MRTIIHNLKQAEQNNANLARQLAAQEAKNANLLNTGSNMPGMANLEAQAANILTHFERAEQNAVQQLNQLDQMITDLQNQLS